MVYKKVPGTHFSWEVWKPLENWIAQLFTLNALPAYLEKLAENALWLSKQGRTRKIAPKFQLFPTIKLDLFNIELRDSIYEFNRGQTKKFSDIASETIIICHENVNFKDCLPPYVTLGLLHNVVDEGIYKSSEEDLEKLSKKKPNTRKEEAGRILKHNLYVRNKVIKTLQVLGGLFHPEISRKQNPAIFLSGGTSTCKTLIIFSLLKRVFGLDHLDTISRHKTRFNFGGLAKEDNSPYILIMDDFRWETTGMHIAEFLNLLDGVFLNTEKKYEQSSSNSLKGSIAITSNQTLYNENIDYKDYKALATRLHEIEFHPIKDNRYPVTEQMVEIINAEAIGFAILANTVFLARNNYMSGKPKIPDSFVDKLMDLTITTEPEKVTSESWYRAKGKEIMKDILYYLKTPFYLKNKS